MFISDNEDVTNPLPIPDRNNEVELQRGFPYVVAVIPMNSTDAFCTGTLIGPNLVLSAAHCFFQKSVSYYENRLFLRSCNNHSLVGCVRVSVGAANTMDYSVEYEENVIDEEAGEDINVVDIIVHESYFDQSTPFYQHDLAILILEKNVTLSSFVQPVDFIQENEPLSDEGIIMGWGYNSFNDSKQRINKPTVFRHGNVDILTLDECQEELKLHYNTTEFAKFALLSGNICSKGINPKGSSACDVIFHNLHQAILPIVSLDFHCRVILVGL